MPPPDPRNGLCLNALHDRAFDRGLITFDQNHRLLVSPALSESGQPHDLTRLLTGHAGKQLRVPARFAPDGEALAYHRERVFQNG